jgi:NADPH:quinone reductase-like Zn-dependent oxidoreductase
VLAAYAAGAAPDDPLAALEVGQQPEPSPPDGWVTVTVRAAVLNHHDLWSLRGVGLAEDQLPMILGCDATLDPRRTLLSERYPGTLAERVAVPRQNLVAKPAALSFEEAACLPTAWLTAYRMLFTKSGLQPGQTVLVQGAAGGVASAAIALGRATGLRVWATSRDERKRAFALEQGAHEAFESGQRLPERVDAVLETVGEATWKHTIRSLRPGGRVVVAGATSGPQPPAELSHVFFRQLEVIGSTMGTKDELRQLIALLELTGIRPRIDRTVALADAREGFAALAAGDVLGKIAVRP